MKKYIFPIGIALVMTTSGCGSAEKEPTEIRQSSDIQNKETQREIIVELKQTVAETPERDRITEEIKEKQEFKDGIYGTPTDGLAENLSVQQVEGPIAIAALEEVYGGENGFRKEGILFYGTNEEPGFWIGIKNPDERVDELVNILQEKVDKGEIIAKYIYIFKNSFTQDEQRVLTDKAHREVSKMAKAFHNPGAAISGVSVNTLNGVIEIEHNFLTGDQMEQLRELFPDHVIEFTVQGRMAPKEGEPDVVYPEKKYTDVPNSKGEYILSIEENEFFIGSTYYEFTEAKKKLKVGQRVIVTDTGYGTLSYPGQGTAIFVEVLPDYKPDGADLSEFEVAAIAAEKPIVKSKRYIQSIEYVSEEDQWVVSLSKDTVVIKDE